MKTKQAPGVSRQVVEPGKLFGKNPMAGNKKAGKADDKPGRITRGTPAKRLEGKRI